MSLLKNIRSNFFSNKNSFSIGFGNRSPLSVYSSAYVPTDYSAPKVPVVSSSPSDWYDPTRAEVIAKQQEAVRKVGQNIVKNIEPSKPSVEDLEKKYDKLSNKADKAYAKNTKKGDKRGDKFYDKAEELMYKHNIKFPWER